jgi:hypothetical protein
VEAKELAQATAHTAAMEAAAARQELMHVRQAAAAREAAAVQAKEAAEAAARQVCRCPAPQFLCNSFVVVDADLGPG